MIQLICRWKCPASVQKYAQVGAAQNVGWLRAAHAVRFDAVRTNNMVALDNAEAIAEIAGGERMQPRAARATATGGAGAASAPAIRGRVEVEWGDEWYAGVVTSRKRGLSTAGADAMLYRVLHDAAGEWEATHYYHDFAEERWRPAAA